MDTSLSTKLLEILEARVLTAQAALEVIPERFQVNQWAIRLEERQQALKLARRELCLLEKQKEPSTTV